MKNPIRITLLLLLLTGSAFVKAQVPLLSSYPSASAVVFLDFDGQTVENTSWNANGPIYCGASGVTNTQITEIFNRVSEDYRPFNLNITTDSTVYWAAPADTRVRVIMTVTSSWYGLAGGVSFVGSFTWGDNTPAFVFTELLKNNTKNIAEATSHEVGHSLGLYHQSSYDANCNKITDYNAGLGTGEIAWAPIMGVGYSKNFTLWNNGPNSFGCTNLQSDLDLITTGNGFSYRTDDYSSSLASAYPVTFQNNQFDINGIIERNTDQDMFQFTLPSFGEFKLNAIPFNVGSGDAGSNIDLQISLYDYSKTLLKVYNPGTLLRSIIDTVLGTGDYYLTIEGKGNIYAPNYASLGSYSLNGTFAANSPLALRKLELQGSIKNEKHELNWTIDADENVTSQILEISTDGIQFSPLTQPDNTARYYNYFPLSSGNIQYRLNVTFDNGRQYYSNIVTLKSNENILRPRLAGNLITSSIVTVNSPGNFNYMIIDLNGKTVNKGLLSNGTNTINLAGVSSGMYMIRFADPAHQWTDKLLIQ